MMTILMMTEIDSEDDDQKSCVCCDDGLTLRQIRNLSVLSLS